MLLENLIGEECIKQLKAQEFYCVEQTEEHILFEHSKNRCLMIIRNVDDNFLLNFRNVNGETFLKSEWYLGNKDGICREDIFILISKPEFKNFSDVSLSWEEDTPTEKQNKEKVKTVFEQFFNIEFLDEFIKIANKYNFIDIENIGNRLVLVNKDCDLKIEVFIDEKNIWCKDLFSGLSNCIGTVDDNDKEKLLSFEKTLSLRLYEYCERRANTTIEENLRINQSAIQNSMPNGFKNVRLHEPKQETTTQKQIKDICDNIADLLIYKNKKYGNSALEPKNIFYKGNAETSILIRLDDKLGRVINNTDGIRINDVCDIIGYLVLYLVLKNISKADIEKLKD